MQAAKQRSAIQPKKKKNTGVEEASSYAANFTLPENLPVYEVNYPMLTPKCRRTAVWQDVINESDQRRQLILNNLKERKRPEFESPFLDTECEYMRNEIFPVLLPALSHMLKKSVIWNATSNARCFFNGIDHLAQEIWNSNPRYPERKKENLHLFNMPWVRKRLEYTPRPYYPKSWLWTEEHAAIIIQKWVRQYFIQKDEEVQEMREFWRKLKIGEMNPHISANPFLAKKFASEMKFPNVKL